jgi:DNA-binding response OmpR family regulator
MRHVIVVDDDADICRVLGAGLVEMGRFRVSCAACAEAALAHLACDRPDLALIDAVLPAMSGLELAVRAMHRDIPVLLMTGHPGLGDRFEGLGWPYLKKPFRLHLMIAEVEATLARAASDPLYVRHALDRLIAAFEAESGDFVRLTAMARRPRETADG